MQEQDPDASPFNTLPPVVVALTLFVLGIEAYFYLGARGLLGGAEAIGWRSAAIERFAFSGAVFDWMVQTGQYPLEHLLRFVSYGFVHHGFTHVVFVIVFLLAMGKLVGEVFGGFAVVLIYVVSSVVGALAYGLLLDDPFPLIGGFPAVYGLIGAYTFLLWIRATATGESQLGAFRLIGFLLGIQLIFGVIFGAGNDWVAEIAGFVAGFLLCFFLVPGAFQRFLDRMRQR